MIDEDLRHQNFWLDPTLWKRIFEQGMAKLLDDGLLVGESFTPENFLQGSVEVS